MDNEKLDEILGYFEKGILHDNQIRRNVGIVNDDKWRGIILHLTNAGLIQLVDDPALSTQHILSPKGDTFFKHGGYRKIERKRKWKVFFEWSAKIAAVTAFILSLFTATGQLPIKEPQEKKPNQNIVLDFLPKPDTVRIFDTVEFHDTIYLPDSLLRRKP